MEKKTLLSRNLRNKMILLISLICIIIGIMTTIIVLFQVRSGIREGVIYKAKTDLRLGYKYLDLKYPGEWKEYNNRLYKGTILINNNNAIIKEIANLTGGTVTIFHHDKRVATNVLSQDGSLAIGTQVSPKVAETVLQKGKIFLGSANVVNHLYQTAYMPLRDSRNNIIGMWYVGVSEKYIDKNFSLLVKDILFLFFTLIISITLISIYIASKFYVPVEKIEILNHEISIKNIELEKAYSKVEELAKTDPLTGLLNRRAILSNINYEINRHRRNGSKFSIMMIDIDDFKMVNDNHGHDCGDYVLKTIAEIIGSNIRAEDSFSRWGGEEFLLILVETELNNAKAAGEKLRQSVYNHEFNFNRIRFNVSITIGIAEFNNSSTLDKSIRNADEALYEGKKSGKNCVQTFTEI